MPQLPLPHIVDRPETYTLPMVSARNLSNNYREMESPMSEQFKRVESESTQEYWQHYTKVWRATR